MELAVKVAPVEYQRIAARPSQTIMATCNKYANDQVNSKTEEVLTSAVLGAAIGAAVGGGGGAAAGGGRGRWRSLRS
jgi:outer membrane lipoprotein SlyB